MLYILQETGMPGPKKHSASAGDLRKLANTHGGARYRGTGHYTFPSERKANKFASAVRSAHGHKVEVYPHLGGQHIATIRTSPGLSGPRPSRREFD